MTSKTTDTCEFKQRSRKQAKNTIRWKILKRVVSGKKKKKIWEKTRDRACRDWPGRKRMKRPTLFLLSFFLCVFFLFSDAMRIERERVKKRGTLERELGCCFDIWRILVIGPSFSGPLPFLKEVVLLLAFCLHFHKTVRHFRKSGTWI